MAGKLMPGQSPQDRAGLADAIGWQDVISAADWPSRCRT